MQTAAGITLFLHALLLFPKVAERVFEEIQSVTQGLRLPRVSDQSQMPYTTAVWKEVVRWRPILPLGQLFYLGSLCVHAYSVQMTLGVPHVNLQDEIVKGYFIPKGTIIHQNNE
jgi:hypothetical protein